jgi:hypothetical protein
LKPISNIGSPVDAMVGAQYRIAHQRVNRR